MERPGDQVHRLAAAGVEVGGVGRAVGVDGHQYPLPLRGTLKDVLPVGEQDRAVGPMAQGGAAPPGGGQGGDEEIGRASCRERV